MTAEEFAKKLMEHPDWEVRTTDPEDCVHLFLVEPEEDEALIAPDGEMLICPSGEPGPWKNYWRVG